MKIHSDIHLLQVTQGCAAWTGNHGVASVKKKATLPGDARDVSLVLMEVKMTPLLETLCWRRMSQSQRTKLHSMRVCGRIRNCLLEYSFWAETCYVNIIQEVVTQNHDKKVGLWHIWVLLVVILGHFWILNIMGLFEPSDKDPEKFIGGQNCEKSWFVAYFGL